WINLACARLDGVVGADGETTTRGDENISPILPLLAGKEISAGHGRVRYIREGVLADGVHVSIALGKGKYVCVLRGEQLRSHFAPAVGIRHDGLWKVLGYCEKHWHRAGRYRLTVDLEKVPGKPSMADLLKVPRPSQLDDWDLYKRLDIRETISTESRKTATVPRTRHWPWLKAGIAGDIKK
ncbi:uncharacterized protein P884DRAFT_189239, partial [Thermothelomyces heterothallicus CBS 202.75]|uniref:uncharacterized protein n=1 Tax=Thermothelomyces heterothallicus CBS 202.75 TaxID=1149848 RepID=UPI00374228E7